MNNAIMSRMARSVHAETKMFTKVEIGEPQICCQNAPESTT